VIACLEKIDTDPVYLELSVEHPLAKGVAIAVKGRELTIAAEEYCEIADELCSLALICPHQAPRIMAIAHALDLQEVKQYMRWLDEGRKGAH
jgi:hypothetical protein